MTEDPRISANTAVRSQLSTLPDWDREQVNSALTKLVRDVMSNQSVLPADVKPIPDDETLFNLRVNARLRALIRIERDSGQIEIIAIARPEQLEPYVKALRRAS
jgi:hypothetical protein